MGLYSTDMLVTNTSIVKEKKEDINIPDSFFFECLSMMLEENMNINSLMIQSDILYESDGIIKSLLSKIDLGKITKKILDSFIDITNKLWKGIQAFVMGLFNNNTVIIHYKKKLENIKQDIYYSKERYIFTNLGSNTSYTTLKIELNRIYDELQIDLNTLSSANNTEKLWSYIEELSDKISNVEEELDYKRGQILATNSNVSKEDYATGLFNYFRNNGTLIGEGNITVDEIKRTTKDFFESRNLLRSIEKDKTSMTNESKKLQNNINSIKLEKYSQYVNEKIQSKFADILKFRISMIQGICDLYLQLFSAKIDAVKDYTKQSRAILTEACKTLKREEANNDK